MTIILKSHFFCFLICFDQFHHQLNSIWYFYVLITIKKRRIKNRRIKNALKIVSWNFITSFFFKNLSQLLFFVININININDHDFFYDAFFHENFIFKFKKIVKKIFNNFDILTFDHFNFYISTIFNNHDISTFNFHILVLNNHEIKTFDN